LASIHAAAFNDGGELRNMLNRRRVLIADDHLLLAELCKRCLEAEFDVVGIAGNGRELVGMAIRVKPDVIVLDIAMPILNGLDAGEQIKRLLPAVKLVYLTMNSDVRLAVEALVRGAAGYLLKTCASSELIVAVRSVLGGKSYLSSSLSKDEVNAIRWERERTTDGREQLTERQREVLQCLAEGRGMKEIAGILNMTTRTVAFHKYRIMNALGVRTNAELVRHAVRFRMVA
jgi:DNA-binding NarL/FixJ family response regulator